MLALKKSFHVNVNLQCLMRMYDIFDAILKRKKKVTKFLQKSVRVSNRKVTGSLTSIQSQTYTDMRFISQSKRKQDHIVNRELQRRLAREINAMKIRSSASERKLTAKPLITLCSLPLYNTFLFENETIRVWLENINIAFCLKTYPEYKVQNYVGILRYADMTHFINFSNYF